MESAFAIILFQIAKEKLALASNGEEEHTHCAGTALIVRGPLGPDELSAIACRIGYDSMRCVRQPNVRSGA
jgi:hypothetical protein